jgi:Flagellar protein YcgR/PilZ domain
LELRIGQTVQLITHGPHPKKYYTRLIGHADPHFLILRVPLDNGWTVNLKEGQSLGVRMFCGVSLYVFESRLETLLLNPRNYMLLSCPSVIHETRLRSHERVQCNLHVRIAQGPALPTGGIEEGYSFQDLSGSGAALVGPQMLGEPGQSLGVELTFELAATGTHEKLLMSADLQSVQPLRDATGNLSGYLHGIRFHEVDPRILLLVNELQKPYPLGAMTS